MLQYNHDDWPAQADMISRGWRIPCRTLAWLLLFLVASHDLIRSRYVNPRGLRGLGHPLLWGIMTVLTASLTHELLSVVYSSLIMAAKKDAEDHKSLDSIMAKAFMATRVTAASYFFQDLSNSLIMVHFLLIYWLLCLPGQISIWSTECKVQQSD